MGQYKKWFVIYVKHIILSYIMEIISKDNGSLPTKLRVFNVEQSTIDGG